MTKPDQQAAARAAVEGLLRTDKMKALAVAVLVASTSMAGCTTPIRNQPCPAQADAAPCIQPSGTESGWLNQPRWPAPEESPVGSVGYHLATDQPFLANPQYTQLRAGETGEGGPRYYGGGHYFLLYRLYGGGSSGGTGFGSGSSS